MFQVLSTSWPSICGVFGTGCCRILSLRGTDRLVFVFGQGGLTELRKELIETFERNSLRGCDLTPTARPLPL